MAHNLRFLSKNDLPALYQTFRLAFSDYIQDASHVTEANFTNRAIKNGVDFDSSVGIVDQDAFVGFTLVALDYFYGSYAAFDAFTGIIKPYRGQGLAKAMFDFVVPKVKSKGAQRFYLEVIQENEPAVRAYQKARFEITRELDSFEICFKDTPLDLIADQNSEIRAISKSDLAQGMDFFDWQPSWENTLASIYRIPDDVLILGAHVQNKLAGFLVYYPLLNWILNMAVHKNYRHQKIGTYLIAQLKDRIGERRASTKIINVEHNDTGMIDFLKAVGFKYLMSQFEMKLDL